MRISRGLLALGFLVGPAASGAAATTGAETEVLVRIDMRDSSGLLQPLPAGSRVTATDRDGGEVQAVADEGATRMLLPPIRWRLCLSAEGLWADCETLDVSAPLGDSPQDPATVTFTAWPAATLVGRLRAAESETDGQIGQALRVYIGPPPGQRPPRGFEDTEISCSVAEDDRFSCAVPATPLYAAVRLSGFVSRYFWGLAPEPARQVDLGTVRMERGASLAGDLDLSVEGLEAERVSVRLTPATGPDTRRAVAGSLEKDSHIGKVTPLGFFQFGGVRPGSYMLEVTHPSFAITQLGPFQVFEGKETRLRDPVRLQPPVAVTLRIEPAASPLGEPWRVTVSRERDWSTGSDRIFAGEADETGAVELARQSPGLFMIAVSDREGNRFHSAHVRIEPGESGLVPIVVPVVRVRGEIRLGSEPVRATLRFGGAHGGLRTRMTADEDGRFVGVLARDGEWIVEIDGADPAFETTRRVEVTPGSDGQAELEILLDDTELVGRVITVEGRPVPDAQVKVDALSELVSRRSRTDDTGEFRFRALPAGAAVVTAQATVEGRTATGTPARVSLEDGISTGPVEIVLEPLHSFAGRVSSPSGPVPGARIHASSLDRPLPGAATVVSDFDGRFTLEFPYAEGLAAFSILPPGGFLTTVVQTLENPLELQTASAGGTLRLTAPAEGDANLLLSIAREGVNIAPPLLAQWNRGHGIQDAAPLPGATTTYPRMAEGVYRVCAIDQAVRHRRIQEGASWQQIEAEASRCATGTLTPGGTLELSLDPD